MLVEKDTPLDINDCSGWGQIAQAFQQLRIRGMSEKQANLHMDQSEVFLSNKTFECPICKSDCNPGEGIIVKDCLHTFCRYDMSNGDGSSYL
jgi:hypothetical protein